MESCRTGGCRSPIVAVLDPMPKYAGQDATCWQERRGSALQHKFQLSLCHLQSSSWHQSCRALASFQAP